MKLKEILHIHGIKNIAEEIHCIYNLIETRMSNHDSMKDKGKILIDTYLLSLILKKILDPIQKFKNENIYKID